jgi:hypothetical protein
VSKNVRLPEGQAKGYTRADLADAWQRYVLAARALPSPASQRPSGGESAGDGRDGSGTEDDSGMRPADEQQLFDNRDAGTDGTAAHLDGATCAVCGDPLDQALIDAGYADHGEGGE